MISLNVQNYLFDLHGSLVIDDVLTCQEVSELNRLIDESGLTSTRETAGEAPRRRRGGKRAPGSSNGVRPSPGCSPIQRSCQC